MKKFKKIFNDIYLLSYKVLQNQNDIIGNI